MKKYLFIFLLISLGSTLSAQDFGIRAGLNVADIVGEEIDNASIVAYQAGVFTEFNLTSSTDINIALLYNLKGSKDNSTDETANLSYLELPVLFRFNIAIAFLEIGPYGSYILSADADGIDIQDMLKSTDFGLIFGGGVKLGNISVDVRYGRGFANINDYTIDDIKNSVITLGAEFRF